MLDRLGYDLVAVNPAAIVGDFNHHLIALMVGLHTDSALCRLAGGGPLGGRFDAVIHGVADEVGQRLAQNVENALIEVGVFAAQFKLHLAAARLGHVTHQAREAPEELLHRHHADLHHRLLQIGEHA